MCPKIATSDLIKNEFSRLKGMYNIRNKNYNISTERVTVFCKC